MKTNKEEITEPRIRLYGNEYIMVGGAIATREQYENFEPGFAHLMEDGTIMRYGQKIGDINDITWIDPPPNTIKAEIIERKQLT